MSLRVANLISAAVIAALAAYVFVESRSFGERSALVPTVLAATLGLLALVLFVSNLRRGAVVAGATPFAGVPWGLWLLTVASLLAFGLGTLFVGFYESAFVFIAVIAFAMSREQGYTPRVAGIAVLYAAGFTVLLFIAFKIVLRISTPPGLFVA